MSQGWGQWPPSVPRPPRLDDAVPVPEPDAGGLTFMWSEANNLTSSMSKHLQSLRAEYTESAAANCGSSSRAEMAEQLIQRFEVEEIMLEQVRLVCWRNFHLSTLSTLPPYGDAILTLRARLNFWLWAWKDHQKHKQLAKTNTAIAIAIATGATDDDSSRTDDEAEAEDPLAQHLQSWRAKASLLPAYPPTMPLYSSIDPDEPRIHFAPRTDLPKPGMTEKYSGPFKTADDLKKLYGNLSTNLLDYRTPARKATDQRARQGSAPAPAPAPGPAPGPAISLVSGALGKERRK